MELGGGHGAGESGTGGPNCGEVCQYHFIILRKSLKSIKSSSRSAFWGLGLGWVWVGFGRVLSRNERIPRLFYVWSTPIPDGVWRPSGAGLHAACARGFGERQLEEGEAGE